VSASIASHPRDGAGLMVGPATDRWATSTRPDGAFVRQHRTHEQPPRAVNRSVLAELSQEVMQIAADTDLRVPIFTAGAASRSRQRSISSSAGVPRPTRWTANIRPPTTCGAPGNGPIRRSSRDLRRLLNKRVSCSRKPTSTLATNHDRPRERG